MRQASFGSTPEVDERAALPESPDATARAAAGGATAVPQRMRSAAPPQLNKRHSSKAKQSVTFGPARVIDPGTPVLEAETAQRLAKTVVVRRAPVVSSPPLLPDALQPELERVRRAFAELLHRWGLVDQRIAVLKLCRDVEPDKGLCASFVPTHRLTEQCPRRADWSAMCVTDRRRTWRPSARAACTAAISPVSLFGRPSRAPVPPAAPASAFVLYTREVA